MITTTHSNTTDTRMYEVSQAQETYRESQKHNRDSKESLDSHTLDSKAATLNPQSLNSLNPQTLDSKASLDSKTTLDSQLRI